MYTIEIECMIGGYTKNTDYHSASPPHTITMTDNSESEVAIARAKNTNIFQRWEKLASGDELKHGGRTFIKGHVNVVVGTMLTDEDRLIARLCVPFFGSLISEEGKREGNSFPPHSPGIP